MNHQQQRLSAAGKVVVALVVLACIGGAYWLIRGRTGTPSEPGASTATSSGSGARVEVGIAYGTEKQRWMEWAVDEFAKTPEGADVKINLIPKGSLEAAQAILGGDKSIHVWSPASSLTKESFVSEWQMKNGGNPIVGEQNLALTPMVFVMWDDRFRAFAQKYPSVSFVSVGQALAEKGGWGAIAGKPEWGLFKFGHTHPNQSNSGLATLVLMAYDNRGKSRALAVADVVDTGFQTWLRDVERSVSGLSNSTGNLMKEMVLKGPSSFDGVFVYENVAIDYLQNAEGRWGTLHVVYPTKNIWNDSPYYVLNVPWSGDEQREAAKVFLDFLMSERVQRQSLAHGFRPGDPNVPIRTPESPFTLYQKYGLQVDIAETCEAPKADVLSNLLASWQRSQGGR
jgi:hypothetical protein